MSSLIKKCLGCGESLQNNDENMVGYVYDVSNTLCKRCYRYRHYGDYSLMQPLVTPAEVLLQEFAAMNALFIWVIDLFHLEESLIAGLNRHIGQKDIIIVATKRELYPITVSSQKISQMIANRIKDENITFKDIIVVKNYAKDGQQEVFSAIKKHRKGRDVVVFGVANVGKSTLINALFPQSTPLTVSQFPGTTVALLAIEHQDFRVYDTPGIEMKSKLLTHLTSEQIKVLQPKKPIRPKVFQLYQDQTLVIGQMAMIHIYNAQNVSVVLYMPENVDIHRCKQSNALDYWNQHTHTKIPYIADLQGKLVQKHWKHRDEKLDFVFFYIGFISISGTYDRIVTESVSECHIESRKAVI